VPGVMRRAIAMAGVCALSFGVAFAAGSMTRDSHRVKVVSAASAPTPVRVAPLASAPGLPGLRVTVAPRKRSPARPAVTLAAAVTRPTPNRRAQVVAQQRAQVLAQAPRVSAPAPKPKPAPTAAASGPSVAFFDEGD
jgi:hypothetical protein